MTAADTLIVDEINAFMVGMEIDNYVAGTT